MPVLNIPFGLSVLGAFLASTVVAYTYVWPVLRALPRYDALRLLAAFNAFRFFGMNFMVAGFVSPALDSSFASQIGWGDFIAAILALLSMAALSWRWAVAIPIVWIFNVWGALDLLNLLCRRNANARSGPPCGGNLYPRAIRATPLRQSHADLRALGKVA